MKIRDLLKKEGIKINANCSDKLDAINQAVELMNNTGVIVDKEKYKKAVLKREEESTTGVGEMIAIPHGKSEAVKTAQLAAMTIKDGVDYDSLDGEDVKVLFLIAAPKDNNNVHLEVLSKLSQMLMNRDFIKKLIDAKDENEFLDIIDKEENRRDDSDKNKNQINENKKFIIAVIACPTGIAHTYMAAEALENKAHELGYDIKVETRGSSGAKNVLTDDEIKRADGVIIACDTNVPMDRFDGKKIVITAVADGINKSEKLINEVLSDKAKVYKAEKNTKTTDDVGINKSKSIYKYLMNGVSHMLPFVVGGGILIAIAFLIDGLNVDINSLSDAKRAEFGTISPIAATFKNIGSTAFNLMLAILSGYIAMAIADRPALVVGFVGGAIAQGGTSGFLGALAAGFLAGYIIKLLKKITYNLPSSIEGIKTILIFPVFGVLIIGVLMMFIIEPVVGFINTSLNDWLQGLGNTSEVVLGMILGGMMSIDMGGPFNKASYVFGTSQIVSGNYNIMAAVMIGGMVAPCAIALATILFKNKFTENERKSGPVNFIMGLSFITEGAIPFAASDPIRVIPSCIVGSAIAGGLSMFFGCGLMAPHGGIFVFPVVTNALMYLVSLIVGTIVSAILLGILKKNK